MIRTPLLLPAFLAAVLAAPSTGQVELEPDWDSLDRRPCPEWFPRAQLGVLVHWGVHSVPAWGPAGECTGQYRRRLAEPDSPTASFHARTYGEAFEYRDFASLFRAELFDADAWAELFARAGARYLVVTAKGADGFCLWPSVQSEGWNSADVGPRRDLVGELAEAARRHRMRFGVSYALAEQGNALYPDDLALYVDRNVLPQLRDLVRRYRPELVYASDGRAHSSHAWRSEELLAWLFDETPCGADVVVDDGWGRDAAGRHGSFLSAPPVRASSRRPWELRLPMGASPGYNRCESLTELRSAHEILRRLCDTVAGGGNLVLVVGPTADGRIPLIVQERLLEIGRWMEVHGEAVHGAGRGPYPQLPWGAVTAKPGRLYLCVFDTSMDDIELPGIRNPMGRAVCLDAPRGEVVEVTRRNDSHYFHLPERARRQESVVIAVEIEGEPEVEALPIRPDLDGILELSAAEATIHGDRARRDTSGGRVTIADWTDARDWLSWDLRVYEPAFYMVELEYASPASDAGTEFAVIVGEQVVEWTVDATGGRASFAVDELGALQLAGAGDFTLEVRPTGGRFVGEVMRLLAVRLVPIDH